MIVVANLDRTAQLLERIGFTLTPRAHHPWGTDNRLVQLCDQTFLELLEISRPALIPEPDYSTAQPEFSFGAHNRNFLVNIGTGISMVALIGRDAKADARQFATGGLGNFAMFSFGRAARQPDGQEKEVAFDLAFAQHAAIPHLAFFTCHNKYPENFWKPAYQHHRNGALGLARITLSCNNPGQLTSFLTNISGTSPLEAPTGHRWLLGTQSLELMAPDAAAVAGQKAAFTVITITVEDLRVCQEHIINAWPEVGWQPAPSGFQLLSGPLFGFTLAFQQADKRQRS